MAIRLNQSEINWFKDEYLNGRTIDEMAIDTGFSKQNVKRALAEADILNLSWYKTKKENELLMYLRSKDITSLTKLKELL